MVGQIFLAKLKAKQNLPIRVKLRNESLMADVRVKLQSQADELEGPVYRPSEAADPYLELPLLPKLPGSSSNAQKLTRTKRPKKLPGIPQSGPNKGLRGLGPSISSALTAHGEHPIASDFRLQLPALDTLAELPPIPIILQKPSRDSIGLTDSGNLAADDWVSLPKFEANETNASFNPLKYYNEDEESRNRILDVTCKVLNRVSMTAAVEIIASMSPPLRAYFLSRMPVSPVVLLGLSSKVDLPLRRKRNSP